jgi:hypothetical protein
LLAFELSQKLPLYSFKVRLTTKSSFKGAVLNLVDEHVAGPATFPAAPNVELSLLIVPASFQDGDVVGSANFSHKLCEFFICLHKLHKGSSFATGNCSVSWLSAVRK